MSKVLTAFQRSAARIVPVVMTRVSEGGHCVFRSRRQAQGRGAEGPFPLPGPSEDPALSRPIPRRGGDHRGSLRSRWPHSHSAGQVLHVTSGKGIVATRSGRRFIEPGDIVIVTPGEWHWHGGTTSSAMTHVAMQLAGSTKWEEPELNWARDYDEM
jgi:mannose-6-phosphate isomerase-like protein (cupin superfamily)